MFIFFCQMFKLFDSTTAKEKQIKSGFKIYVWSSIHPRNRSANVSFFVVLFFISFLPFQNNFMIVIKIDLSKAKIIMQTKFTVKVNSFLWQIVTKPHVNLYINYLRNIQLLNNVSTNPPFPFHSIFTMTRQARDHEE